MPRPKRAQHISITPEQRGLIRRLAGKNLAILTLQDIKALQSIAIQQPIACSGVFAVTQVFSPYKEIHGADEVILLSFMLGFGVGKSHERMRKRAHTPTI